jgi:hypothetical protein
MWAKTSTGDPRKSAGSAGSAAVGKSHHRAERLVWFFRPELHASNGPQHREYASRGRVRSASIVGRVGRDSEKITKLCAICALRLSDWRFKIEINKVIECSAQPRRG